MNSKWLKNLKPGTLFIEVVGSEARVVCLELGCLELVGSEAWGALSVLADGMFFILYVHIEIHPEDELLILMKEDCNILP